MNRRQLFVGGAAVAFAPAAFSLGGAAQAAPLDYDSLAKIRAEGMGLTSSKVMDLSSHLCDVLGPRLSGSPGIRKSGEWVVSKMKEFGFENAALEPWPADPTGGNNGFPRGWENQKFYLHAIEPLGFPISGMSVGWTPGTNGLVKGECVIVTDTTQAALKEKWTGKLRGKWILGAEPANVRAQWDPVARRYTREQLDNMENPARGPEFGTPAGRGGPGTPPTPPAPAAPAAQPPAAPFNRATFFRQEGALGILATNKSQGVVNVLGASRTIPPDEAVPTINIIAEHYGRIFRSTQRGVPVTIEADIRNVYFPEPAMFNVVGEVKGSSKPDEVVIVGGHFDSFHAATGATDNGGQCMAALEALRILKTTGVPLARTVRVCLWNGEEQGLIGSRLYVREHFGGARVNTQGGGGGGQVSIPAQPAKPAHAKFQAYFNLDNGGGAIRGIYAQQNGAIARIFREWMEPLRNIGVTHVNMNTTGSTDHASFEAASLPGFQFIQDPIDYEPKTHHTNMDFYESLQPEDMRRNATILASFCFLAANHPELLPRKGPPPVPAPVVEPPPKGRRR